jgi:aminopeptidase N
MKKKNSFPALLFLLLLASSCSSYIRFMGHNPNKAGDEPVFSHEQILLGENTPLRNSYDVFYYDLSLRISPKEKYLSGKVEMYATTLQDVRQIQIDLHKNFTIDRLYDKGSGKNLTFKRDERAVIIDFKKPRNKKFILCIEYSGQPVIAKKPPWIGGFVWKKDNKGKPWIGVACEPEGASLWWPLKDLTSDEPDSMRLHYEVPETLAAVGNGQLEGIEKLAGSKIYNWYISYPINTYNATVYVGGFKEIKDIYTGINGDTLRISYYVLDKNYEKAEQHFQQVKSILAVYESKYGKYPFYNDGFKLVESPFAGMEHQTAIAYGNKYKNDLFNRVDYIILHETAHEWWGNSVTAKDFADIWLQEGFATYSEILFLEDRYDPLLAAKQLNRYKFYIMNKYPMVSHPDRRYFHYKNNLDAYSKGAWLLHTLRKQINNDEIFFDILKSFAEEKKYQLVSSDDFVQMVNTISGNDYTWFFEQYLYHRECPVLSYMINDKGVLYFTWYNMPENFNQFKISLKSGDDQVTIVPNQKIQAIKLPPLGEGKKYRLKSDVLCYFRKDPNLEILFKNRP